MDPFHSNLSAGLCVVWTRLLVSRWGAGSPKAQRKEVLVGEIGVGPRLLGSPMDRDCPGVQISMLLFATQSKRKRCRV